MISKVILMTRVDKTAQILYFWVTLWKASVQMFFSQIIGDHYRNAMLKSVNFWLHIMFHLHFKSNMDSP